MRVLGAILTVALVAGYPAMVYLGATRWSGRGLGLALLLLGVSAAIARAARTRREHLAVALRVPMTVVALALVGVVSNDRRVVMLLPALVNAALFAQFATSLRGMPLVERFARMQHDDLAPAQVRYCRTVTVVWCAFFVLNGGFALFLASTDQVALWSLHAGVFGYVGMGLLGASEYLVRKWRFRIFGDHPLDRALARLMAPRPSDARGSHG